MHRSVRLLVSLLLLLALAAPSLAAPLRLFVEPFTVAGVTNKDELKAALPMLLASRLNSDRLVVVDNAASADLLASGSYLAFGKVYSLDALVRDRSGKVVARAFEQGEDQNQLIPAMGNLADKLAKAIPADLAASPILAAQMQPVLVPAAVAPVAPANPEIIRKPVATSGDLVRSSQQPEIIRPKQVDRRTLVKSSNRLNGAFVAMAPGRALPGGERELYIAERHGLRLFRQKGTDIKQVAEVSFGPSSSVLALDSADVNGDGVPEVFVTVMDRETLVSQVWSATDQGLKKLADKLPYFFRSLTVGKERKVYAQEMALQEDFYGPIREVSWQKDRYVAKEAFKLPRFGNLYTFSRFSEEGQQYTLVLDEDRNLIVYDDQGKRLWHSSDRFGGTDINFKREDLSAMRASGSPYRSRFLEQRVTITPDGEIIIPQNTGTFVAGNQRNFTKYSVVALRWNGSMLEETWRTRETESALTDYFYDPEARELVILQGLSSDSFGEQGASSVVVKKVD